MNVFNSLDKFFNSLNNYLSYNYILIIFLSLFIATVFIIFVTTSFSYEAKLIKSIDMFNSYFIKNPQITAENLLDFNSKMKSRKVPKQLRKQWQQFVLYRDKSASEYMSFELCVSSPIKNSTYKRDVTIMNIISYILALVSLIMNLYHSSYEAASIVNVLQHSLLCPILILVLNLFFTIVFDIKHNAIVSDLNQNFQYFEVNIDKATSTIPEYVDYEVLFDKNEIKRGMPILYIYLQRRAEEEKRELERARLKNVEHEKFNFDEAGVAKSLVLERAMQEAENYIAERKKFLQDTEQINSEITQEEMNFREITKEYQREMQVSKETFDNFKSQLNDVSSSIEANYLKKQQQQELDRQRNLERDYDTATDRHNALLKSLQEALDNVNGQITKARTTLERGMMSEFDTYSQKVYADAERVVKERTAAASEQQKQEIAELKQQVERLTQLNSELGKYSSGSGSDSSGANQYTTELYHEGLTEPKTDAYAETYTTETAQTETQPSYNFTNDNVYKNPSESAFESDYQQQPSYDTGSYDYAAKSEYQNSDEYGSEQSSQNYADEGNSSVNDYGTQSPEIADSSETEPVQTTSESSAPAGQNYSTFTSDYNVFKPDLLETDKTSKDVALELSDVIDSVASDGEGDHREMEKTTSNTPKPSSTKQEVESKPGKKRGRPRKPKPEVEPTKRKVGRPRKPVDESELNKPKRPRGRPRKDAVVEQTVEQPAEKDVKPKTSGAKTVKGKRGNAKIVSAPAVNSGKEIEDLDSYLQEIDNQIAEENAKMEASKKELEKNSRIRKRRR